MGIVTLTFNRLTLKLVCESHLRWGTFLPNLGTLGLWVLELFAMHTTDEQTDGRTDGQKLRLLPPSLRERGHNNIFMPSSAMKFSGVCYREVERKRLRSL